MSGVGIRGIVWRDRGVVGGWQFGSIEFQFAVWYTIRLGGVIFLVFLLLLFFGLLVLLVLVCLGMACCCLWVGLFILLLGPLYCLCTGVWELE